MDSFAIVSRWAPSDVRFGMFAASRRWQRARSRRRWPLRGFTKGDVPQVLSVAAEFRPFQEIDVHAKVAGYLKSINVDVGDRVQAGQLLAVLEIPELQDELHQDEAAVKRAQEEVNRAQADLDRAESGAPARASWREPTLERAESETQSRRAAGYR